MASQIIGTVSGQSLVLEQELIVTGTNKYLTAEFKFSPDWDGLSVWAHFDRDNEHWKINLHDGKILREDKFAPLTGYWEVCLHGTAPDGMRITTQPVDLIVKRTNVDPDLPLGEIPGSVAEQIDAKANEAVKTANDALQTVTDNLPLTERAEAAAKNSEKFAENAKQSADNASISEGKAQGHADNAETDANKASQALADLLRMMGTDIATLVGGKIPASQIPSIATTEIYPVASQEEQDAITAQNGDICIRSDENKSYIWKDTGWVYLASPSDYASRAGYADRAGVAENANTINGHRLVQIPQAEWDGAVKDPETYYLVYDATSEV